jgi:hypothetical protein
MVCGREGRKAVASDVEIDTEQTEAHRVRRSAQ